MELDSRLNRGAQATFEMIPLKETRDETGRLVRLSAIDGDESKIRSLADRLQRAGYGVLREQNPRAGRVYYRLNALWAGPGAPPAEPLSDA